MKEYLNKEFILSNKEKIIKGVVVIILVTASLCAFALGENDNEEEFIIDENSTHAESAAEPIEADMIMVDVCGAVNEPKVVQLKENSRVTDAIDAAGGFTENADTTQINQAAFLTDGEKVYVPEKNDDATGTAMVMSGSYSGKVNINTASSEELQTLEGVGPVTAEKILKYRSDVGLFKSVDDIKNVSGIGDKTFENIKEYIQV